MFGLRDKWGRVKRSKVEFARNKLILGQIYSTLLPLLSPQSKRIIRTSWWWHHQESETWKVSPYHKILNWAQWLRLNVEKYNF